MPGIGSLIRSVIRFSLNISKRAYRNCAILTTGICIIAVIAFSSRLFMGSGKNKICGVDAVLTDTCTEYENSDEDEDYTKDFEVSDEETISKIAYVAEKPVLAASPYLMAEEENYIAAETEAKDISVSNILLESDRKDMADDTINGDDEAFEEQNNVEVASFVTTDGTPVTVTMKPAREITEEEYNILTHIVEAEAGGADIYGRILVANVILNRVDNKKFPNNIKDVVFQKNQFSPATKGTIWIVDVDEITIEAVNRALNGEDYSCGALFFAARKRLAEGRMKRFDNEYERLFEHEGHEFFKFYD